MGRVTIMVGAIILWAFNQTSSFGQVNVGDVLISPPKISIKKLVPQVKEVTFEVGSRTHFGLRALPAFQVTGSTGAKAATILVKSEMIALRAEDAGNGGTESVTGTVALGANRAFAFDKATDFTAFTSSIENAPADFSRPLSRGPSGMGSLPHLGVDILLTAEVIEANPTKKTAVDVAQAFIKHRVHRSDCGLVFASVPDPENAAFITVADLTSPVSIFRASSRVSPLDFRATMFTPLVWSVSANVSKTAALGDVAVTFNGDLTIWPRGCPEEASNTQVVVRAFFKVTDNDAVNALSTAVPFMVLQREGADLDATGLTGAVAIGTTTAQPVTIQTEKRFSLRNVFRVLSP